MKARMYLIAVLVAVADLLPPQVPAAPFSPKVLKITGPNHKGTWCWCPVEIPITISGTDATVILGIFTKDKSWGINGIKNGYLGWHYIHKIDTCLYISPPQVFSPGEHKICWDGRAGVKDVMTYYLWAYDHASQSQSAALHIPLNRGFGSFVTRDIDGKPLARPIFIPTANQISTTNASSLITRHRWVIGNDPDDATFVEATRYPGWSDTGALALDPKNLNRFFVVTDRPDNRMILRYYEWMPNGEAVLITKWGENGSVSHETGGQPSWWRNPGIISDGGDFLFLIRPQNTANDAKSELVWLDYSDGTEIKQQDLSAWWTGPAPDGNGNIVFGPTAFSFQNRRLSLASNASSVHMLLDPYADDERDLVVYANGLGDGLGDKVSGKSHDPVAAPRAWSTALDSELFSVFPAEGINDASFGLLASDGRGVGYFAFSDPGTPLRGAGIIDYSSAYDGMYVDCGPEENAGLGYIARDTFKGIIVFDAGSGKMDTHFNPAHDYLHENRAALLIDSGSTLAPLGEPLTSRDEIGIFTPSGMCVGNILWDYPSRLDIFGDDPGTPQVDGLRDGEKLCFRFWDFELQREFPVTAILDSAKTVFHRNERYTLLSLRSDTSSDVFEEEPARYALLQNSPNPFNPSTTISFTLPHAGRISLVVYDVTGRQVAEPARGFYPAGTHSVVWNARGCASGVYFCTLRAGSRTVTRKMLLVR